MSQDKSMGIFSHLRFDFSEVDWRSRISLLKDALFVGLSSVNQSLTQLEDETFSLVSACLCITEITCAMAQRQKLKTLGWFLYMLLVISTTCCVVSVVGLLFDRSSLTYILSFALMCLSSAFGFHFIDKKMNEVQCNLNTCLEKMGKRVLSAVLVAVVVYLVQRKVATWRNASGKILSDSEEVKEGAVTYAENIGCGGVALSLLALLAGCEDAAKECVTLCGLLFLPSRILSVPGIDDFVNACGELTYQPYVWSATKFVSSFGSGYKRYSTSQYKVNWNLAFKWLTRVPALLYSATLFGKYGSKMGFGRIFVPFSRGPNVLACYSAGLIWDLWQSANRFQYFYGTVENPLVSHGQQNQSEQDVDVDVSSAAGVLPGGINPPCDVVEPDGSSDAGGSGSQSDEFIVVEPVSEAFREKCPGVVSPVMEDYALVDVSAANDNGDDEEEFLEFDVSDGFVWVDDPNVPEWILDEEYCKTMICVAGAVGGLSVFGFFNLMSRALITSYNLSARARKNFKSQLKKLKKKFSSRTTITEMLEECPYVDNIRRQRDGTFLVEARVKTDDSDKDKPSIWFQLGLDPNDTKPKEGKKGKTKGGWSMRSVKHRTQDSTAKKYSFQDIYDDANIEFANVDNNWMRLNGEEFKDYWDKHHDWYKNHIEFVLNGHDAAMDYGSSRLEGGALKNDGPVVPTTPSLKAKLCSPGFRLKKLVSKKESAVGGSMIELDKYKIVTIHTLNGTFVGNGFCYGTSIMILKHYFENEYGLQVNTLDSNGLPKRWEFRYCDCVQSQVVDEIIYLPKSLCSGSNISSTKKGFVTTIDKLSEDNCVGAVTGYRMNGNGDLVQYFSPGDIVPPSHDKVDVADARGDHACDTQGGCCGSVVIWSRGGTNSAIGLHCYGGSTDKSTSGKAPNGYIPFGQKLMEEANRLN